MAPFPISLEGFHSTLRFHQPAPGIILLTIDGHDAGEHGAAPFQILEEALAAGPTVLFIDARDTRAASPDVSARWAQWLSAHRQRLRGIHMLPGSWFVEMTARFVRKHAGLEELMHVHDSSPEFEAALAAATGR